VMARSTVFRYKGQAIDPQRVGRELAARALLVGEVAPRGDSLVIEIELVDVETGWRLWGEHYCRKLSDLLAVEEEISREITEKLRLRLNQQDARRLAKRPTVNPEAYQDYLKGRFFWNRMTEESVRKAVSCFERAIEKDPSFALAYTGLSDACSLLAFFDLVSPPAVFPKAREAALKALQIDEGLAEAHASLAGIAKTYDWDWQGAERELQKALELNPNYADAHRWYADLLCALGRPEDALRESQKAQELDPLSLVISMEMAWNLYMSREYTRAVQQALNTLEMEPNFSPAHFVLALAYEQMGKYEVAFAAFEKIHSFAGNNSAALAGLGHAFGVAGQKTKATGVLKVLEELSKRRFVSPYSLALVLAGLGKANRALQWLEKSVEIHDVWLVWLSRDPRFDGLRLDPRFQAILGRIGLLT
jgi:tetratricopeptide (TPR) repeat protein